MFYSKGPYEELFIYEIEGEVKSFPEDWPKKGFIGCWPEENFSFLFFHRPLKEEVIRFVDSRPGLCYRSETRIDYTDWEAGRELTSVQVGGFLIHPPWVEVKASETILKVVIDPGVSFGSGFHPTTKGCLWFLWNLYKKDHKFGKVLDLGTGSGILAICAARVGAGQVLAVDNNPLSVATARWNVMLNRLEDRVKLGLGDVKNFLEELSDLVIANLTYPLLSGLLEEGFYRASFYILSGLIGREAHWLREKLEDKGLEVVDVYSENLWFTFFVRKMEGIKL